MELNDKPEYQQWNEEEFRADVYVQGMTWLQRHLYRALLHCAFFHSTRPFLPSDDDILWVLAGAESLEMWLENKPRILKRFTPATHDPNLLENKRVTADWLKLVGSRMKMSELGQRSAAARVALYGSSAPRKNRVLTSDEQPFTPSSDGEGTDREAASELASELASENSKASSASENSSTSVSSIQEQNTGGTWKNLSIRHFRLFGGKKPSVKFSAQYAAACLKYGEQIVLDCFDSWANGSASWIKSQNIEQPLFIFFKNLDKEAEDAVELAEALKEDDQRLAQQQQATADREKQAAAVQADSIERQTQEIIARRDARPQVSEVSMEDFLEAK